MNISTIRYLYVLMAASCCVSSVFGAFKQTNEATSRPSPMGITMTVVTIPVDLIRPSAVVVVKKLRNSTCQTIVNVL